jgi:hypothetical protein
MFVLFIHDVLTCKASDNMYNNHNSSGTFASLLFVNKIHFICLVNQKSYGKSVNIYFSTTFHLKQFLLH